MEAFRLHHEREIYEMHRAPEHLCRLSGYCEWKQPKNGFARAFNRMDHERRVHGMESGNTRIMAIQRTAIPPIPTLNAPTAGNLTESTAIWMPMTAPISMLKPLRSSTTYGPRESPSLCSPLQHVPAYAYSRLRPVRELMGISISTIPPPFSMPEGGPTADFCGT